MRLASSLNVRASPTQSRTWPYDFPEQSIAVSWMELPSVFALTAPTVMFPILSRCICINLHRRWLFYVVADSVRQYRPGNEIVHLGSSRLRGVPFLLSSVAQSQWGVRCDKRPASSFFRRERAIRPKSLRRCGFCSKLPIMFKPLTGRLRLDLSPEDDLSDVIVPMLIAYMFQQKPYCSSLALQELLALNLNLLKHILFLLSHMLCPMLPPVINNRRSR